LPLTTGAPAATDQRGPLVGGASIPGDPLDFRTTLFGVRIHASARKHGVVDDDIRHAVDHALVIEDIGEDPDAMSMRPIYERLLRP
jgi:hypothetical protein